MSRVARATSVTALGCALLVACGERVVQLPRDAGPPVDVAPAPDPGCADGEREGFLDAARFLAIAACSGAWSVPGVVAPAACGREGGDDGPRVDGAGCAVEDLCAAGWHVCHSASEVTSRLPTGETRCEPASGPGPVFFVTAQSGSGGRLCDGAGDNDLFGCGTAGSAADVACAPLDRWSGGRCRLLPTEWSCGRTFADDGHDASLVVKNGPAGGGVRRVLLCREGVVIYPTG
jgi:hypothetical protein